MKIFVLRAHVIESALYGVICTRFLCQKPSLARSGFRHKQLVHITPYAALSIT